MDGWIDRQIGIQIDKQIDRYIDRQTDRQIDRCTDRQIDTHIHTGHRQVRERERDQMEIDIEIQRDYGEIEGGEIRYIDRQID